MAKSNYQIIYGIHTIKTLIKQRAEDIISLYINKIDKDIKDQAEQLNLNISYHLSDFLMAEKQLQKIISNVNHQGIIAFVKEKKLLTEIQLKNKLKNPIENQLWLILDQIQDPQNFGSIIRNAEGSGVTGVIIANKNQAPISAIVHKVSSGASQIVDCYQVANLVRVMQLLQKANIWTIGLHARSDEVERKSKNQPINQLLYKIDLTGNIAFILGAEGQGLRERTLQHCDQLANLPMKGQIANLNVANTSAIILYESLRQRMTLNS